MGTCAHRATRALKKFREHCRSKRLKDKFRLWWQVTPTILGKLMADKDQQKANRVMEAMLQMDKLDIEPLQRAYEGG